MNQILDALKALYVALGGSADDVADLTLTPDVINAIATKAAIVTSAATSKELPANPTANGSYNLQCTKSNSGAALSWEAIQG